MLIALLGTKVLMAQHWFPENEAEDAFMYFHEGEPLQMIDTGLTIQEQINLTLTGKDEFGQYHLGNLGSPTQFLLFDYHKTTRLQWGMNPYPVGRRPVEDVGYYNVKAPLVSTRYLQGYNRGQSFDVNAKLNVHERLNYNIRFQRLNSIGLYERQMAEFNNFTIGFNYRSPDNRIRLLGHFDSFSRRNQENGGLSNPDDLRNNVQPNRELVNIRLNNHNSATKQRRFYISGHYDIGYYKRAKGEIDVNDTLVIASDTALDMSSDLATAVPDSVTRATDTLTTDELENDEADSSRTFVPLFTLGSNIEYNRYSYVYTAQGNLDFFENSYFDFNNTFDSTRFETFEQRLYIGTPGKKSVRWFAGTGYELGNYGGENFNIPLANVFVFGKGKIDWKGLDVRGNGQFNVAGTQLGNFLLEGQAGYANESLEVTGLIDLSAIDPGVFYRRFISNHFVWDNPDFSAVNHQYVGGRIRVGKWLEGQAGYHLFQNYTTLNQQAIPEQFGGVTQLFQAVAHTTFEWGKALGWKNDISYQITDDALGPIRVPQLHLRSIVYTNFTVYYNRLNLMPGIEAHYFSSYYAPNWMPATGMFHLQNNELIGNFPYINFFVNVELKRALIFIKLENITEDLLPREYFIAPGYPLPDFVLRLGIKWDFYN